MIVNKISFVYNFWIGYILGWFPWLPFETEGKHHSTLCEPTFILMGMRDDIERRWVMRVATRTGFGTQNVQGFPLVKNNTLELLIEWDYQLAETILFT